MDRLRSCFGIAAAVFLTFSLCFSGSAAAFNEDFFKKVLLRYDDASLTTMAAAQLDGHARELLLWSRSAYRDPELSKSQKLICLTVVEERLEHLKDISKQRQAKDGDKTDSAAIGKSIKENQTLLKTLEAQKE